MHIFQEYIARQSSSLKSAARLIGPDASLTATDLVTLEPPALSATLQRKSYLCIPFLRIVW
jgi:hypothetical protein